MQGNRKNVYMRNLSRKAGSQPYQELSPGLSGLHKVDAAKAKAAMAGCWLFQTAYRETEMKELDGSSSLFKAGGSG